MVLVERPETNSVIDGVVYGEGVVVGSETGNDKDEAVVYGEIGGIVNSEGVAGESEIGSDGDEEHEEDDEVGLDYWVHMEGASDNDDDELQRIREVVREIKKNKRGEFDSRSTNGSDPSDLGDGPENVECSHGEGNLNFGGEGNMPNNIEICRTCLDEGKEFVFSSDDEEFSTDSEDEDNVKRGTNLERKRYDPNTVEPHFDLHMIFLNNKQFKKAVVKHAVLGKRDVRFQKDEKHRCRAVCRDPNCAWRILCSIDGATKRWVVKTFWGIHTCEQQLNVSLFKYKVIAEYLKNDVGRLSLKMNNDDMRKHVKSKLGLDITMRQCRCAKRVLNNYYLGEPMQEFSRLEDYCQAIRNTNEGSTVILDAPGGQFNSIYICLDALRRGFKAGCRPIIGLDGCFLKGPLKGQILSAIGRDANDQMYPLAWAVVKYETKATWKAFLISLMVDLGIAQGTGYGYTFVSDQQKGLGSAIHELLPESEHRRCARHKFAKWRKKNKTEELQKQFWITCKASTVSEFKEELDKLGLICPEAKADFENENPQLWCKVYQRNWCKSDVVDNNMSETFNNFIYEARDQSITSLLECIRKKCMKRICERRDFMKNFNGEVGPRIWKKIQDAKERSWKFLMQADGGSSFEVTNGYDTWVVNMRESTCTCRIWDLCGIPCDHALCVIRYKKYNISDYLSHWYKKSTFDKSYNYPISACPSKRFWPVTGKPPVDPPVITTMPGRPRKNRTKEQGEPSSGSTIRRRGRKMSCSYCQHSGHRRDKCKKRIEDEASEANSENVAVGNHSSQTVQNEMLASGQTFVSNLPQVNLSPLSFATNGFVETNTGTTFHKILHVSERKTVGRPKKQQIVGATPSSARHPTPKPPTTSVSTPRPPNAADYTPMPPFAQSHSKKRTRKAISTQESTAGQSHLLKKPWIP